MSTAPVRRTLPAPFACPRCHSPAVSDWADDTPKRSACTSPDCHWSITYHAEKPTNRPKPPTQTLLDESPARPFSHEPCPLLCPQCHAPLTATRAGATITRIQCTNPKCHYDRSVCRTKNGLVWA